MSFRSVVSSVASGVSRASTASSTTYLTGYTPVAWYRFSLRTIILVLLPLISFLGAYGTWTLGGSNGLFETLASLLAENDPKFPGTEDLLIIKYTGLKALDYQLAAFVAFFAPVVDMNYPALNLFSVWGLGQFGAVWTLMMMESMRLGNKGKVISYIGLVGIILQNISYTITAPLWLFIHLVTSPVSKPFPGTHANSVLLISPLDLRILPLSITLSYLLPSILIALPSPYYTSPETHQRLLALWQAFPLLTILIHRILRSATSRLTTYFFPRDPNARPPTPQGASYLANAKHVYRFVLTLCIVTHIPIILLTFSPTSLFTSPLSTPSVLLTLASQSPSSVFAPYFPLLSTRVPDLAKGVQAFLQWDIYIGSSAFVLWATLLYRNATTEKAIVDPNTSLPIYRELLVGERRRDDGIRWRGLVWKVFGWGVLGGPIGATAVLLWERDEIVRQKIKQGM